MATAARSHVSDLITPEVIAAYRRDGAVLVKGALSSEELEWLEAGLEETRENPSEMFSNYGGTGGYGATIVDQFPSLRCPSLHRLMEEGPVAELAGRVMQTPSAQLILDQVFYKEAGQILPTPWHQDTPFLRVRGNDMARVWLSCDPSPAGVTLEIVRGSHLWNVVFDTSGAAPSGIEKGDEGNAFTYDGIGDERLPPVPDIEGHRDSFDIISWDVEPGDAVIFHGNILHGTSGRENHPYPRRAFACMLGGPQLRFQGEMVHGMPLPSGGGSDAMPHGAPIGEHTGVFPIMWRAD